jgi:hypothetical protein
MDRKFVMTGLGYAIVGLLLGIYMAASKNHGELVAHAHIMLLGFVVSFIYGLCHRLWLNNPVTGLARVQFWCHQTGTLILAIGLFLYYGRFVSEQSLDPVLATGSFIAFAGMLLMQVMFIRYTKPADRPGGAGSRVDQPV